MSSRDISRRMEIQNKRRRVKFIHQKNIESSSDNEHEGKDFEKYSG